MRAALVLVVVLLAAPSTGLTGTLGQRRGPMLVPRTDRAALRAGIYRAFPRVEGRWGVVHVVDRTCSTSRWVIDHLLERRATVEVDELVIVVDRGGASEPSDSELVHAGFQVRIVRDTHDLGIGSPSMIVARPDGDLAYVGGHLAGHLQVQDPAGFATNLGRDLPTTSHEPRVGSDRAWRFRRLGRGDRGLTTLQNTSTLAYVDVAVVRELISTGRTDSTIPIGCE